MPQHDDKIEVAARLKWERVRTLMGWTTTSTWENINNDIRNVYRNEAQAEATATAGLDEDPSRS